MKIVLVSNYLNHHQIPFCEAMMKECDEFNFVATDNNHFQGYQTISDASYVIHYYNEEETATAKKLIREADAVIFGGCPNELIAMRMLDNKLSFLYSERFFKKGTWRCFIPTVRKKIKERIGQYGDKNIYVLCASAFLSYDLSLIGFPVEKCIKWGYFPEVKRYDDISSVISSKEPCSLLWVGRFLNWKHPEAAVQTAKNLKMNGYTFELNMIGGGEQEANIARRIEKTGLCDCVHMLGSKTPEQVREYMEKSEILLFTSDRYEGWGAVLNEAMNSGCAVVASSAIGSVPFLLKDGENGLIYPDGNADALYRRTEQLISCSQFRERLGTAAYHTMQNQWNSVNAAKRFLDICNLFPEGAVDMMFENGVCSKANLIKDRWYKM